MSYKISKTFIAAGIFLAASTVSAFAGPLMERIEANKTIRIGFANEIPWAYSGKNNSPDGFVNAHTVGVLKAMGYTNIEPVVTDWGGLIPGLQANRFDMITGGMYILEKRCKNVSFSEPMAKVSDAFMVKPGNPKGIHTMEDLVKTGAIMVAVAGHNTVDLAKRVGVPASNIIEVPGASETLAAVKAGRADAAAATYFSARDMVEKSNGAVALSDVTKQPTTRSNWVGIGFRHADADFRDKFNAAQAKYIGTKEMLAAVGKFGYGKGVLPDGKDTEWVCKNR